MIAIDTNILIYAHRSDSPFHIAADCAVTQLAESGALWAIPWPCVHEFLAIVTHPKIYDPPTPMADASEQVECWLEVPTLVLLGEDKNHWRYLRQSLQAKGIRGPMVHDARIAAICASHDVQVLWTADRDFERFGMVKISNPLR